MPVSVWYQCPKSPLVGGLFGEEENCSGHLLVEFLLCSGWAGQRLVLLPFRLCLYMSLTFSRLDLGGVASFTYFTRSSTVGFSDLKKRVEAESIILMRKPMSRSFLTLTGM